MKKCAVKPCPTCPWRKSSKVGGEDIPNFSMEKMRNLANTVPPRGSDQDGFYSIMACHHSPEGAEFACAGYIAVHGLQNINVRLLAAFNKDVDLSVVIKNCEGIDLYSNFYEMLDAYEDYFKAKGKESGS